MEEIEIREIRTSKFNLRIGTNGISELADSIRRIGLLHSITVRMDEQGFEIIAGNRRYYACKKLGWKKIPCSITDADDKTAYELSIIENVQRRTLDALEEARAFKKYVVEYGWGGVSDLAEKLSKSPSYVSKRIRLTELPIDVLELISESELPITAAEEILYLKKSGERSRLAALVSKKKISTRGVRQAVREIDNGQFQWETGLTSKTEDRIDRQSKIIHAMNKSIIALRTAMATISSLIDGIEENWLFYDILMQHRNIINSQIDLLIRQKRKAKGIMLTRWVQW